MACQCQKRPRVFGCTGSAMKRKLTEFLADEEASTAIEYALIATIMGIGVITSLEGISGQLGIIYNNVASLLSP